jgi:two-component system response regulator TtrR
MPLGEYARDVGIVDDDEEVRRTLRRMLEPLGLNVHEFATGTAFLADQRARTACSCLIVDVRLPGMSGIELYRELRAQPGTPSVVFISGHGDIPMAVDAMRDGAADFLPKPFKEQQLIDSVQRALLATSTARDTEARSRAIAKRLSVLTPREHEVLQQLLRGKRAKDIAIALGIAVKTAEEHRAHVMRKMRVTSVAQLMQICRIDP